ncbi:MAG: nucleotide kinase domain-containing protein [Acidimicrobiia bacterium]
MYFRRLGGAPAPWTLDPIIGRHRFTNAYRVLDRVSQYLVGAVAYEGLQSPDEVFFRVMVFKLFNRIETWQLLQTELGWPTWAGYRFDEYDRVLSAAMERGDRIYSAAYIMPPASQFGEQRKHRNHLRLLENFMADEVPTRVATAPSMSEVFRLLRSYPSIGDFLAYQLATDLNYSAVCDFDEMEFVVPGPGARDGIAKCFSSLGDWTEAELIRWVADTQLEQLAARGLAFQTLQGRPLQLIDCQNLFCEVDKYARVAHPEVVGRTGRTRIKQQFHARGEVSPPVLPPKWSASLTVDPSLDLASGNDPWQTQDELPFPVLSPTGGS